MSFIILQPSVSQPLPAAITAGTSLTAVPITATPIAAAAGTTQVRQTDFNY